MRTRPLILAAVALGLAAGCARDASPATTPAIAAAQAQAGRVLAEISMLDQQVNVLAERYDGARVQLGAVEARLREERALLAIARLQFHTSERRAASLLVYLYTAPRGSPLNVLLGASSLSELLTLADDESAISGQAAGLVAQIDLTRQEVRTRVGAFERDRRAAAATVAALVQSRDEIERRLALRRTLLASVEAQVARLEAQERIREARLAAEARARLAAEAAARARAEAVAQALARAAAQRAAAAALRAAATAPPAPVTAAGGQPISAGEGASVTPTPPASPSPSSPAGYPQAASIALQYLGVPYVWGGESPSGFDCSGLVAYVYAQLGIDLPHYAADQWNFGVPVARSQLQPGDLVFFDDLGHVGIYIGDNEIVNAPYTGAFVRIDSLSEPWLEANYYGARQL